MPRDARRDAGLRVAQPLALEAPKELPQPRYATRADSPGARGCWALKRDGEHCGAARRADSDFCNAHEPSAGGVASSPAEWSLRGRAASVASRRRYNPKRYSEITPSECGVRRAGAGRRGGACADPRPVGVVGLAVEDCTRTPRCGRTSRASFARSFHAARRGGGQSARPSRAACAHTTDGHRPHQRRRYASGLGPEGIPPRARAAVEPQVRTVPPAPAHRPASRQGPTKTRPSHGLPIREGGHRSSPLAPYGAAT